MEGQDKRQFPSRRLERGPLNSRRMMPADRSRPRKAGRQKRTGERSGRSNDRDDKFNEPVWNAAEVEYFGRRREQEAVKTVVFQPGRVTEESFNTMRPAVVSGEGGMNEILDERLALARKFRNQEYVEWQSKEQKADVMTLVERLRRTKEGATDSQKNDTARPTAAEVDQQTQLLLQKLFGGGYELTGSVPKGDILGQVTGYTDRNESYFPNDQKSLLEKVRSLMPQNTGRGSGESSKNQART